MYFVKIKKRNFFLVQNTGSAMKMIKERVPYPRGGNATPPDHSKNENIKKNLISRKKTPIIPHVAFLK
jgi:hypothetical protein